MISKQYLHGPINGLYQSATQRFSPCLFRRGTGVSNLPLYILVVLLSRRSHQHLSITLSSNLSWYIHVENIIDKAGKRVDIMVYPKYRLDCSSLETIYEPFIRPILEYGDIMLSNMTEEQTTLIEQLNKTAGKIMSRGDCFHCVGVLGFNSAASQIKFAANWTVSWCQSTVVHSVLVLQLQGKYRQNISSKVFE